ncbi:MAG: hypothetical protein A2756_03825 [Candidatus Ryanbacteria bacterium RIFCSPHIGHO2_01_FULL_48_27]|uniref:ComEC/Rec2-related protein domain-containing protein n=1 Tax=Candidatus Ryanbacteria bacterium RIFCSPHIGHO2_01_FULL_48_27 TaxID=1802115 RepID=A0A1G2G441_9BACT|nr:MAG: hypothetical protein A2756_03825 [Candidatus Ryanbacteria bacterium RIFCSPHIGHO2_01_FULL_48_27]
MPKARAFLCVLCGCIAGIAVRSFWPIAVPVVYGLIAGAIASFSFGLLDTRVRQRAKLNHAVVLGMMLMSFGLGIWRYDAVEFAYQDPFILGDIGPRIVLEGVVAEESQENANSLRLVIELKQIAHDQGTRPLLGRVVVYADEYPSYVYGDKLRLSGVLERPEAFDGFDYPAYLKSKGVYALMRHPQIELIQRDQGVVAYQYLLRIKQRVEQGVEEIVPEPHASLLKGLLVGSRTGIPEDLSLDLQRTGTTHIVALSGFNITIIAENIAVLMRVLHVGAVAGFWIPVICVIGFTVMTGASASIVRASIMGILVLIARREGRSYQAANAIVCAGTLMMLYDPRILRFDVGFQLSFLATFGIVYLAPIVKRYLGWFPQYFGVRENLASTLGAQASVLPTLIYYFGTLSFISPLANILVLSFIPITMAFGFAAVLAGFAASLLGMLLGGVSYALLSYELFIIHVLGSLPFASVDLGHAGFVVLVSLYGGVFLRALVSHRRTQKYRAVSGGDAVLGAR